MSEKKKNWRRGGWLGYSPFSFCAGSRYNKLYHDIGTQGCAVEGHDTASNPATQHHDTARRPCDTAGLLARRAAARERSRATEVCHDTIVCIVTGGRPGVMTQCARGYYIAW